jgi:hypothetical protein
MNCCDLHSAISDHLEYKLISKPQSIPMQGEWNTRRKSGLSVCSDDVTSIESSCAVIYWPQMSSSEMLSKCARRDSDSPKYCREEVFSPSCTESNFESWAKKEWNSLPAFKLSKSSNFCSPILKEDKGSEAWRDFL